MSSPHALHTSLLRPAIIHILRAAGFHTARPSIIDTLTDLTARYLLLLASRTADQAHERVLNLPSTQFASSAAHPTNNSDEPIITPADLDPTPTLTDVRLALDSVAFFASSSTASEEAWAERLRKPLAAFPAGAREKERQRREEADTRDVREFVEWATGPTAREQRRIAGLLKEEGASAGTAAPGLAHIPPPTELGGPDGAAAGAGAGAAMDALGGMGAAAAPAPKDDYLSLLKKKHSKTGDSARYAGTVLGRQEEGEGRGMRIEGGPGSLRDWRELKRKRGEGVHG